MCLLIVEICFFVAGLWLEITGKIPQKFFSFMFGKGNYVLSPAKTRLFGLLLLQMVPVVLFASLVIGLFFPRNATTTATIFEIVYDLITVVIAVVLVRKFRQPAAVEIQQPFNPNLPMDEKKIIESQK